MGKNFFCMTMKHIIGEGIKAWYSYGEGIILLGILRILTTQFRRRDLLSPKTKAFIQLSSPIRTYGSSCFVFRHQ